MIEQFDLQDVVEKELIETMTAARWRLRRLDQIETNLLSTELVRRAEDIDAEFTGLAPGDRLAWVFQKLADRQDGGTGLVPWRLQRARRRNE